MATTKKRTGRKSTGPKADPYQIITDRIIDALEAGVVPWQQPWDARTTAPRSLSSRKPYSGVNVFTLVLTAMAKGYSSPWWGTYKQISERGGQVKAGEKGTPVVFWRVIEVKDDKAKNGKKKIPLLRYFIVFNSDQAEGDDFKVPAPLVPLADHDPIDEADSIVSRYVRDGGPSIGEGDSRAFYNPMIDYVEMPLVGQFKTVEAYYSTLFHELGHSTGHADRLNRDGITDPIKFGSEPYGREELIAEMTAAFLCGESGVEIRVDAHAGYIASWLSTIKGDPKLVVQAAGAAQKAANLVLGRERPVEDDEAGEES